MAEEKKKFKRKPLSRSRRLGRRRKKGQEEEEESGADEGDSGDDSSGDDDDGDSGSPEPEAEATRPVSIPAATIPSTSGSGTPDLAAPPPAERMAKIKGSVRRFTTDFSHFLFGLGQSAHQSGQAFGQNVVKPFSQALVEAAISLAIIFVTGVAGLYLGRYLKINTTSLTTTVVVERQSIQPAQNMDESFFTEGFQAEDFQKRATLTLTNYLDALKGRDYKLAYYQLSKGWQADLPYDSFEGGYSETVVESYDLGRAEVIDKTHIRIHAELSVTEKGQKKEYKANYLLVLTSEGWKLDGGAFH